MLTRRELNVFLSLISILFTLLISPANAAVTPPTPSPAPPKVSVSGAPPPITAPARRHLDAADDACDWSYWNRQCEPVIDCEYAYEFGDLTFAQSCRARTEPAPDTPSPTVDTSCGSDAPDDNCCGWSYGTSECVPQYLCKYTYNFGDISLTQSCRVNPDRDSQGGTNDDGMGTDHGALSTFLRKLTVNIPDQSFEEQTGVAGFEMATLTMDLTDLVCKNAYIGNLGATTEADSKMTYSIGGIGATCSGNWAYKYGVLSGEGDLTAVIADTSASLALKVR